MGDQLPGPNDGNQYRCPAQRHGEQHDDHDHHYRPRTNDGARAQSNGRSDTPKHDLTELSPYLLRTPERGQGTQRLHATIETVQPDRIQNNLNQRNQNYSDHHGSNTPSSDGTTIRVDVRLVQPNATGAKRARSARIHIEIDSLEAPIGRMPLEVFTHRARTLDHQIRAFHPGPVTQSENMTPSRVAPYPLLNPPHDVNGTRVVMNPHPSHNVPE